MRLLLLGNGQFSLQNEILMSKFLDFNMQGEHLQQRTIIVGMVEGNG